MIKYSESITHIQSTLCNLDDKLWVLFNALGDCARYRIVKVLMYHRNLSVTELANILEISVPAASQQLKTLEQAGIVTKKRSGQAMHYALIDDNPHVNRALKLIDIWLNDDK